MQIETPNKLVDDKGLQKIIWTPESAPCLRTIARMRESRVIPAVRIGRLVFYDPVAVRAALEKRNTVQAR